MNSSGGTHFATRIYWTPLPPRRKRDEEKRLSHLPASDDLLTGREKMIMKHVAEGLKHKQMAHEFGGTAITVEDSPWQHDEKGWGALSA
jgi:FixJ family two-component response regulator